MATGELFLLMAGAVLRLRLPSSARTRKAVRIGAMGNTLSSLPLASLLLTSVVLLAMVLIGLYLLTDGALEDYTSIYLCNVLGSGPLLGGIRFAIFQLTGMLGRQSSTVTLRRYGDRRIITVASMLSVVGMLLALSTSDAPFAVSRLLLVGLGQSPIARPHARSTPKQVRIMKFTPSPTRSLVAIPHCSSVICWLDRWQVFSPAIICIGFLRCLSKYLYFDLEHIPVYSFFGSLIGWHCWPIQFLSLDVGSLKGPFLNSSTLYSWGSTRMMKGKGPRMMYSRPFLASQAADHCSNPFR